MNRFTGPIRLTLTSLGLLGLPLLVQGTAAAQNAYQIQPIVKFGDRLGDVVLGDHLDVGVLNDNGQIAFLAGNADGDDILLQYAGGKLTPIVVPGGNAPGGTWGTVNGVEAPVSMNQLGDVVFATDVTDGRKTEVGTYLWDAATQKVTLVARPGMPVGNNLTLETGGEATPAINNSNEIALVAAVKNAAGQALPGVFFLGRDARLLPVALPDQALPDGRPIVHAHEPSINDAGAVAFLVRRQGDGAHQDSAYLWEKGVFTPLALVGAAAPGGSKFAAVWAALLNNKNGNVLVAARLGDARGPDALYLYAAGKLNPVLLPGQPLPGGGKFKALQSARDGIGVANGAGQHACLVVREDGTTAAYGIDTDGKLSLILASGMTTPLGKITQVGIPTPPSEPQAVGIALNGRGQVALNVQFGRGPITLVLLTPVTP